MPARSRRALILVENNPVPFDKRAWPECLALKEAGFEVVVICPHGTSYDREPFERRDGVDIYRYPPVFGNGGAAGYVREYANALWHTWRLARRLGRRPFDVVHACNPPDLLLLAALPLKRRGARFIFDHHDLVPELYRCRFGTNHDLLYRIACAVERLTFRLADVVISTNDSYRAIALRRGGKRPEDVFVVRNGPDPARFRPVEPDPSLKRGRAHLISYVGLMGPQDGVDLALRALAHLKARRRDWHALFVGDGDVLDDMRRLATALGVEDEVEFTGLVNDRERIKRVLATSDVCLAPEPKNPLNDASTMIKIGEYMAMARPIVSFDLVESRVTAGEAALYATPNDAESCASCIEELLDDPERRAAMGAIGRSRVERGLSWQHSKRALLAAYERALDSRNGAGV